MNTINKTKQKKQLADLKAIAKELHLLATGVKKPEDVSLGVCYELKNNSLLCSLNAYSFYSSIKYRILPLWYFFSGCHVFPIKGSKGTWYKQNLWDSNTSYGRDRLNFCEFLSNWFTVLAYSSRSKVYQEAYPYLILNLPYQGISTQKKSKLYDTVQDLRDYIIEGDNYEHYTDFDL